MKFLNRLSLTTRLTVVFVAIGTIPLVAMGLYAIKGLKSSDAIAIENLHSRAEAAMDKIERNLFERYGDVQAFGLNAAVFNKADWHKPGAEANAVVHAANSYVQLYGIYALSLVVDTEGKVIAVNDKNAAANELRTYAADVWHAVESMRAVVTGAYEAPAAVRANGAEPSPKQNVKKPAAPALKPQHIFHRRTAEEPNLYSLESSARSESQTAQSQDDAFASLPMREIQGSADTKVRPRANPGDFRDF